MTHLVGSKRARITIEVEIPPGLRDEQIEAYVLGSLSCSMAFGSRLGACQIEVLKPNLKIEGKEQ